MSFKINALSFLSLAVLINACSTDNQTVLKDNSLNSFSANYDFVVNPVEFKAGTGKIENYPTYRQNTGYTWTLQYVALNGKPDNAVVKLKSSDSTNITDMPLENIKVNRRASELFGKEVLEKLYKAVEKIPEHKLKVFIGEEIEKILANPGYSPARKKELIEVTQKEVEAFNTRQLDFAKQLSELKTKYGEGYIKELRVELKEAKNQVNKLEQLISYKLMKNLVPSLISAKAKLDDIEKKYEKIDGIKLDALERTISETDGNRLKDIIATSQKSFGPPYTDPIAKQVDQFIEANPELKKMFKNPDEVNLAIRKFPSDLNPEEIEALKKIRTSLTKVPAEGIPIVKVSFPGKEAELKGFVIDAEHLKGVKSEKDLVDILKLDYPNSPFLKEGKIDFKLSDIQVTVGRVFDGEVSTPFSKEFGGTKDGVLYQYPFSGSGFTTPETGFPKPELDIGITPIKETKKVKWQEFIDKSPEELAPHRNPLKHEIKEP